MAQNIALQVRTPQPDLAAITRAAQGANLADIKMQNEPARSELEALQLQDEIGGQKALGGYREAVAAGDPNAIDKVAAYPKMQQDLYSAFDGMAPQEFMEAKKKARAFGKAAQHVKMFPDGSPEQEQAWGASAKVLKDAGYIDDKQYNMMIESGPSDLIIQQAMTVDQWVSQYAQKDKGDKSPEMKQLEIEKIRAEIEKINRTGADDETSKLKLDLLEAQIARINAQTESEKSGDKKTTAAEMAEKGRNMRAARKEIGEFAAKAMEFATTPEEIAAATAQIAEKRAEIMDFYGLTNEEATPAPTGAVDPEATAPAAESDALTQAREAIDRGADPEAVRKRLEENGIDATGL